MVLLSTRNLNSTSSHPWLLALLDDIQYAYLKGSSLDNKASLLNLTEYFNPFDNEATR